MSIYACCCCVCASGRECVFAHIYLNVRVGIYVYLCMTAHARM